MTETRRSIRVAALAVLVVGILGGLAGAAAPDPGVREAVGRFRDRFEKISGYTCKVDQSYFRGGHESQRFRFTYFYEKDGRIRLDFSSPYPGTTLLYRAPEEQVVVLPIRALPFLRFRFDLDSDRVRSPSGQRLDQTGMEHLIRFLRRNLDEVEQGEARLHQGAEQWDFWLRARDYLKGARTESYHLFLSTDSWFPLRIERYTAAGELLELSRISDYVFDPDLPDAFFAP